MSDAEVAKALRSDLGLVVVQAPGGCGKTYQGAAYAQWLCPRIAPARLLILAHTHAACDEFAKRTRAFAARVEVRTIDSLTAEVASAYPPAAGTESLDFEGAARWAARILSQAPFVAATLARRYPVIICDEHQDASPDQHAVIMALHGAGSKVRIFGDPMQLIYPGGGDKGLKADLARWETLLASADARPELDEPHRWKKTNPELGGWILEARAALQAGHPLRLGQRRVRGLSVIVCENQARRSLGLQLDPETRAPVTRMLNDKAPLLVLSPHKDTGRAIRAASGRRLPIWEGHARSALPTLTVALAKAANAGQVAEAAITFCQEICTGFSDGAFANRFRDELCTGCAQSARGKFVALQAMARAVLEAPDHRGVGQMLRLLQAARKSDPGFAGVHIDYPTEFWEAARLADHEDLQAAIDHQIAHRRALRRMPPPRAISTVHKAKGLEARRVLVMPCEDKTFKAKDARLLYVALSRATESLTLVVSAEKPSPWIDLRS